MSGTIINADCLNAMRVMAEASVDSIVTDPPYGLAFMGKAWDAGVPGEIYWAEALRVAKPGAHLLAFGGARTYHRMVCAIEDAGWEIRDQIMWIYGSGFPKSHNGPWGGTALKPAHEPIVVARKPLIGTVAANHAAHGTGALNIDSCRISWPGGVPPEIGTPGWGGPAKTLSAAPGASGSTVQRTAPSQLGRWPANVVHDGSDDVMAAFPKAPGQQGVAKNDGAPSGNTVYSALRNVTTYVTPSDDVGSAARFFYCAKPGRAERDMGLDQLPKTSGGMVSNTSGQHMARRDAGYEVAPRANNHPTVKPIELMRWLLRLVTPAGGLALDPFAGSGTTGCAAALEGFRFIGIELDPEYVVIAEHRIAAASEAAEWAKREVECATAQQDMFHTPPAKTA